MPQWNRDRARDVSSRKDERWIAVCPPDVHRELERFDHHLVTVAGRRGVLVSYAGHQPDAPLTVQVSFATDRGHPPIPAAGQALIDRLEFRVWDGSTGGSSTTGPA